jgi:hypothetical protein
VPIRILPKPSKGPKILSLQGKPKTATLPVRAGWEVVFHKTALAELPKGTKGVSEETRKRPWQWGLYQITGGERVSRGANMGFGDPEDAVKDFEEFKAGVIAARRVDRD